MNCAKVEGLLFTDYIDDELDHKLLKKVKNHLNNCENCRRLEQDLRATVNTPSTETDEIELPETVWYGIKNRIDQEKTGQNDVNTNYLKQRLGSIFSLRRPAFVFMSIIMTCLFGIYFAVLPLSQKSDTDEDLNNYLENNITFLTGSSLNDEGLSDELSMEFGFFFN